MQAPGDCSIPEYKFIDVAQFVAIAGRYWSSLGWIFRGQGDIAWPLLPKAGRAAYYRIATKSLAARGHVSNDLGRFHAWREEAVGFCGTLPTNDFECLAYAQHYGLATRLLDWTTNPLVALFFAVETADDADGGVYCHLPWHVIDREESSIDTLFSHIALLVPRPFDRRILAQSGVFTYHSNPMVPLQAGKPPAEALPAAPDRVDLIKIRVLKKAKPFLQRQLSALGISRKALFPDLEGLSAFVNWESRRIVRAREESLVKDEAADE
jgi:hypothetical protein